MALDQKALEHAGRAQQQGAREAEVPEGRRLQIPPRLVYDEHLQAVVTGEHPVACAANILVLKGPIRSIASNS